MTIYLKAAAIAVGLTLASAANASPTVAVQQATAEADKPGETAKEKLYCVRSTVSGSRMPQKVCRTRKAWQAQGFDPVNPNG